MPVKELWSRWWGCPIFVKLMPRDRFLKILQLIRLTTKLQEGEGYFMTNLLSALMYFFADSFAMLSTLHIHLIICEQLFPSKVRCRFTQYIANQSDNFGQKVLCHCWQQLFKFPYLGKDEARMSNFQSALLANWWNLGWMLVTICHLIVTIFLHK